MSMRVTSRQFVSPSRPTAKPASNSFSDKIDEVRKLNPSQGGLTSARSVQRVEPVVDVEYVELDTGRRYQPAPQVGEQPSEFVQYEKTANAKFDQKFGKHAFSEGSAFANMDNLKKYTSEDKGPYSQIKFNKLKEQLLRRA